MAPSTWLRLLKKWLSREHGINLSALKLSESRLANAQNKKNARAFCYVIEGQEKIHCCKALALLPDQFIVGILLHEIGHVLQGDFDDLEVGWDAEVDCDELILANFPEAGYHYADVRYKNNSRDARSLECVSEKFLHLLRGWK